MTIFTRTSTPPVINATWTADRYGPTTSIGGLLYAAFRNALDWLVARQEKARQRYLLAELDPRMLEDVGLTRADVYRSTGYVN